MKEVLDMETIKKADNLVALLAYLLTELTETSYTTEQVLKSINKANPIEQQLSAILLNVLNHYKFTVHRGKMQYANRLSLKLKDFPSKYYYYNYLQVIFADEYKYERQLKILCLLNRTYANLLKHLDLEYLL